MDGNTIFDRATGVARSRILLFALTAALTLNPATSRHAVAQDTRPRLGTVVAVEEHRLLVTFEDDAQAEPQAIPLTGRTARGNWHAGMAVRVWPGTTSTTAAALPVSAGASSLDHTGVRRRLSRGAAGKRGSGGGGRGGH